MAAPQWQPKELFISMMMTDCELQAEEARAKLEHILDHLREGDHLAAIRASQGLGDTILYIIAVLERLSALTRSDADRTN
jgi:hypothetical protein